MAIWGSSSSNTASSGEADIKTHLMNQVRQEAAVTNARNLIGVCNLPDRTLDQTKLTKDGFTPHVESQRALLRSLHSQPRHITLLRRTHVSFAVHGEVHLLLERSQPWLHCASREREEGVRWWCPRRIVCSIWGIQPVSTGASKLDIC